MNCNRTFKQIKLPATSNKALQYKFKRLVLIHIVFSTISGQNKKFEVNHKIYFVSFRPSSPTAAY